MVRLNPSITQGFREDEDKFDYNKDADRFVCPAGHMAVRKARQGQREQSKHRYKIEAKNSELKNVHGYGRTSAYGIENMQMQGAMALFIVNLKRILKHRHSKDTTVKLELPEQKYAL